VPDGKLIDTIYGRRSKYTVYRKPGGFLSNESFSVYKDDQFWKSFGALDAAVDAINRDK